MFQSNISCKDYEAFVAVAKESESEALKLIIKYTNSTQAMLQEVINYFHHGGSLPQTSFSHSECILQRAIERGDYKEVLSEGHHKLGNF